MSMEAGRITYFGQILIADLKSKKIIRFSDSTTTRSIIGSKDVEIKTSTVQKNVSSKRGNVTISDTKIGGDVSAKNIESCERSTIKGILSCTNETLTIKASEINTIVIKVLNISNKSKSCGQLPSAATVILEDSEVEKVIFEAGYGRVILKGNSKTPEVTGGEIEVAPKE